MYSSLELAKKIQSRHDGIKRLILKNQDKLGGVEVVETGCKKEIFLDKDQYEKLLLLFRNNKEVWKLKMQLWRELHFLRKKLKKRNELKKLKLNTGE